MYIRASSAHGLNNSQFRRNSHIMGILIQQNSSTLLPALYSLKCSTSRFGESKTLRFGLNITSSLRISLTFRFCQLQVKYKSSFISTFSEYAYESTGLWNWEKCLGWLHHWHWEIQVPECRTSISCKMLVELTPSSQSLSYVPSRVTQLLNVRNVTHCRHPQLFTMASKNTKSKRPLTVGYSVERLST